MALPNGWFGYQNARWSQCQAYYSTCKPTIPSCATGLCNQCYSMGGSGFKACCNEPTPYQCFQSAGVGSGGSGGNGGGNNAAITSAPPPITDPNQSACQTAISILQSCESATPNFDSLSDAVEASCLCYSNSAWAPQAFDGPWSSCIAWASTADASDYQSVSALGGFCSSVGNVAHAPASVAATTTASSPTATSAGQGSASTSKSGAATVEPVGPALKVVLTVALLVAGRLFDRTQVQ